MLRRSSRVIKGQNPVRLANKVQNEPKTISETLNDNDNNIVTNGVKE